MLEWTAMAQLPLSLQKISLFLQRLPGIGEKTANRLAFFFLRLPEDDLRSFGQVIADLKSMTKRCKRCQNLCEGGELCGICDDPKRDQQVITVVESVLDIISFETGGIYQGLYHVLHGKIDPLNRVSPDQLTIDQLLIRLKYEPVSEIVIATNPDMEGEATAMYIRDHVSEVRNSKGEVIKVTRLGYGLPMGGNVEYADYVTLKKAMEGRNRM